MLQLIDSVEARKILTGDFRNFGRDFTKIFQKLLLILGEINEAQAKLIQSRAKLPTHIIPETDLGFGRESRAKVH